jgi:hypothetical protein
MLYFVQIYLFFSLFICSQMRFLHTYLFRFALLVLLLVGTAYPAQSISHAPIYSDCSATVSAENLRIESAPIEPKRKKQKRKTSATKPIWDIVWLYVIAGSTAFLPISLLLFGLGLGANLLWLWAIGLGFGLLLIAALLLLHFSLRDNESTADRFLERWAFILAIATVALFGLVAFIVALTMPLLWLWLTGLIVFLAAGVGAFLLTMRKK